MDVGFRGLLVNQKHTNGNGCTPHTENPNPLNREKSTYFLSFPQKKKLSRHTAEK